MSGSTLPGLNDIYHKEINLADGGLGTTLEDILNFQIAHTPLWSTRAAADEEKSQLLFQAHLSFLRAGARTLLTSTYQAASNTFEREGYSREQALRIMSTAVSIAARARALFCAENNVHRNEICVVLSLGTYGSSVTPMQDFDGIFPPPYGPKAYSATEENTTSFGDDVEGMEKSIQALTEFHTERLLAYARIQEAWDLVDGIAFETVPVAREVTAIRRAVTAVAVSLHAEGKPMKPWWLTSVFPDGRCSETRVPGGEHMHAKEVANLMLREGMDGEGRALVLPDGIGFNCVAVEHMHGLLDQFKAASAQVIGEGRKWPWLVIKPNGGGGAGIGWADSVASCVDEAYSQGWGGMIVGGCCKARPVEINHLASTLKDRGY
ncbi:Homocysteine S-methyltransferase [Butyriboletus roseoflavus]|nr:Homocysteine S-methyltransferase [Butyriboletus roseoflavus]